MTNNPLHDQFRADLLALGLTSIAETFNEIIDEAASKGWSVLQTVACVIAHEAAARAERAIQRRIKRARLPKIKTIDEYDFTFPKNPCPDSIGNLVRNESESVSGMARNTHLQPLRDARQHVGMVRGRVPRLLSTSLTPANGPRTSSSPRVEGRYYRYFFFSAGPRPGSSLSPPFRMSSAFLVASPPSCLPRIFSASFWILPPSLPRCLSTSAAR